jgi:4-hydroxybenzoyl-CoA thioesterase
MRASVTSGDAANNLLQPRVYRSRIQIRFAHCDPAGIVFYPRYFEILNGVVEDWFAEELGFSFQEILKSGLGIPTVHLNVDFIAPSRLGDELWVTLAVTGLGSSSVTIEVVFKGPAGDVRVVSEAVLVLTDALAGCSTPISENLRARMALFLRGAPVVPTPEMKRET